MKYLSFVVPTSQVADESIQEFEIRKTAINKLRELLGSNRTVPSLLPLLLAACGGGGGGTSSPSPSTPSTPTPPPEPDFTENPTGTFTAQDDTNRTLDEGSSTADLIVYGKGGNDSITTGSGADVINGGAGDDTINSGAGNDIILGWVGADSISAGDGDDIIILIGVTSANQYTDSAITSPAGIGADLSALLALADINGHNTSDVGSGETLDGGAGNNSLVIYGTADISDINVSNLTTVWINSTLTLTAAQLNAMKSVAGDGASVLNIVGNIEAGTFDQVDLSAVDLSGIGSIVSDGNVEILISDANQLENISEIITTPELIVTIAAGATISASDLAGIIASGAHIEVEAGATLVLDTVEAVSALGQIELEGDGTIVASDVVASTADSLTSVQIDDDVTLLDALGASADITAFGGALVSDIDPGDGLLPLLEYEGASVYEEAGTASLVFTLSAAYFDVVSFDYAASDGTTGTITFNPGEITKTITKNWSDDDVAGGDVVITYELSNSINVTLPDNSPTIRINDDDGLPEISVINVSAIEAEGVARFTATLSEAWHETVTFYYSDLDYQTLSKVTFAPGETSVTFSFFLEDNDTFDTAGSIQLVFPQNATFAGADRSYIPNATVNYIDNDGFDPDGSPDIPGNTHTDVVLAVGDTVDSTISMRTDRDVIAMDLVAGQTYEINTSSLESMYHLSAVLINPDGTAAYTSNMVLQTTTDHNRRIIIEPDESATYYLYIRYSSETDGVDYSVSLSQLNTSEPDGLEDIADSVNTTASYTVGDTLTGSLFIDGDEDWFQVSVEGNVFYEFIISGTDPALDMEFLPNLNSYNSYGGQLYLSNEFPSSVSSYRDADNNAHVFISQEQAGTIFLGAVSSGDNYGTYTITSQVISTAEPDGRPDQPADDSTTAIVTLDAVYEGNISYSDEFDWIAMELVEGESYRIDVTGLPSGNGTLNGIEINALYYSADIIITNPYFGTNIGNQSILGNGEAQIYWTATASGTYYLSVGGHSNVGSYQVALSNASSLEPDGGEDYANDKSTRAVLEVGGTITGQLDLDSKIVADGQNVGDWVQVTLEAGKNYSFNLYGFDDGGGTQNSDSGRLLLYAPDGITGLSYVYSTARPIRYFAEESGTYYVRVSGDVGTYTLAASEISTSEPDGTIDASEDFNSTALAVVGTDYQGNFSHKDDQDWVGVNLTAGQIYKIEITGADNIGQYRFDTINFDQNYNAAVYKYSDVTNSLIVTFEAEFDGEHFLELSNHYGDGGDYTLTINEITKDNSDGTVDIGDTFLTAQSIADGTTISSTLAYGGDVDYFSIEMLAGEIWSLNFVISPESTLSGHQLSGIYDSSGEGYFLRYDNLYGDGYDQIVEFIAPEDGIYYFAIEGIRTTEPGDYQIAVANRVLSEPDGSDDYANSRELATALASDTVMTGSIGYHDDDDWFEFPVIAGQVYSFEIGLPEGSNLETAYLSIFGLYGSHGTINSTNGNNVYTFQAHRDDVYSLRVDSYQQTGAYTIKTTTIDASEPGGSPDFSADSTTTGVISAGETLEGSISFENDVDWIAVNLNSGQIYTFEVTANSLISAGFTYLYDRHGKVVYSVSEDNTTWVPTEGISESGGILNHITFISELTGTFYLRVEDQYGSATGSYSISMEYGLGEDGPDGSPDIVAHLGTAAAINMNSSITGSVDMMRDSDWYAVTLEAGKVYEFTLTGVASGSGTLIDPKIEGLYDSNGILLPGAYNDDGDGESRESYMLFTPTESGTYYISAGGWDGYQGNYGEDPTGTYELTVSDVSATHTSDLPYGPTNGESVPIITYFEEITNDFRIDSLLQGSLYSLDDSGLTTTVTYSFPSSSENFSIRPGFGYDDSTGHLEPWDDFLGLSQSQQIIFGALIDYAGSFINVTFVEVEDSLGSAGTIRTGWTGMSDDWASAWAFLPFESSFAGDIWFLRDNMDEAAADNYFQYVATHELGHALGLKHTFDTDEYPFPVMPIAYDGHDWSVMSYTFHSDFPDAISTDLYPQTFMYFDILALQYLYGAVDINVGNDTYVFDGNERYYLTMWDNGGNDTIQFVNQSTGVDISLDGAQWQDVGTTITYETGVDASSETYTVFIPEEVTIENVYGTASDDHITGNAVSNNIRGLAGYDTLLGGAGGDIIDGGQGSDVITGGVDADIFVTRAGDGGEFVTDADIILDFTDGEDLIGLNGLSYADLTIENGTGDNVGDAVISVSSSGEFLMILDGVDASLITADDFTSVADEWWVV